MWSARAQCSQGGGHPRGPISRSEITCNRQVLGTMVGSLSRALVLLSVLASASSLVVGPVARQQLQARPAIRSAPLEPPLMKARLDKEQEDAMKVPPCPFVPSPCTGPASAYARTGP